MPAAVEEGGSERGEGVQQALCSPGSQLGQENGEGFSRGGGTSGNLGRGRGCVLTSGPRWSLHGQGQYTWREREGGGRAEAASKQPGDGCVGRGYGWSQGYSASQHWRQGTELEGALKRSFWAALRVLPPPLPLQCWLREVGLGDRMDFLNGV